MAKPTRDRRDGGNEQHRAAAELVGERGGERGRERHEHDRPAQQSEKGRAGNAKRAHAITQRVDGRDVEQRVTDDDRERALDQRRQMVAKDRHQRHGRAFVLIERLERRRLLERNAHIKSDRNQHGAHEKGNSPRPGDKGGLAESDEQRQKKAGRDDEADRRPELREHAVPGALSGRRVLDRDQRRPAPLAAEPNTLQETQSRQRQRREHARARIRRQRADQRRREPHGQHGGDERRFASDAIAEMTEQERAYGPRKEGEAKGQIGVERLRFGSGLWGRTSARTRAPPRCRRYRSRRTRSSCRRGSRARSCPGRPSALHLPPQSRLSSWSSLRTHRLAKPNVVARRFHRFKSPHAP